MRRAGFGHIIAALAASISAPAVLAQVVPVPVMPSNDIVVTGQKMTTRQIEKTASAVTSSPDLYSEPLPQFQEPVCPGVIGLPTDLADLMVARIRYDTDRAKIRLAPPGRCRANLLVIFVNNGQAALKSMMRKGVWLFGNIDPAALRDLASDPDLKYLAAEPGPVHAWLSTETRGRYGEYTTGRGDAVEPALIKTPNAHSHIFKASRKDIVASVVMIDIDAIRDLGVFQIADYAAMRGLARTRPPGQRGRTSTILSLFDQGAIPPLEMTPFDLGYLRAVYGSIPNIAGITKVAQVAHEVRKAANEAVRE